ncbi:MAG: hypothetical protein V2I33_22805 [Kangiellaceae bacterium]|jgi:hypothetical protein|nr:hypothetical protein [Kangiellaceae bacterium]
MWRLANILCSHVRGNLILQPIEKFRDEETLAKYPPIQNSDFIVEEITVVTLLQGEAPAR